MMMKNPSPERFSGVEACVDWIVGRCGPDLRLALPLGLGKANLLANAIYRRAVNDRGLRLTIATGLSLEPPVGRSDLERRFLEPLVARVFGGYPHLEYARDRRRGRLPENVQIVEFFMSPGDLLNNAHAQRNYVSSNYTHVARDLMDRGVNVIGQLVTHQDIQGLQKFSLSCNPDLTLDIVARRRARGQPILMIGEVNKNLPFMYGDAVVDPGFFDALIESPETTYTLFGPPKTALSDADYLIGLNASTLVRDGGTLQLGIGSLGDAVVYALKLRHENNPLYRQIVQDSGLLANFGDSIDRVGGLGTFDRGLYGATEMFVDGFLTLYKSGILKRRVYDHPQIQRLLNENKIGEEITPDTLLALAAAGCIGESLSEKDIAFLREWGVLSDDCVYRDGQFVFSDGSVAANLSNPQVLERLAAEGLGTRLKHGVIAHGGFFLGSRDFYTGLKALSDDERRLINMTSVLSVNQLYGNEVLDTLQRRDARFINSCLIATLMGAVVSDGLDDQRVLSGVGGQFDFVSMAHALDDGRSILKLRSTRTGDDAAESNIRLSYGHTTVPRHMRDFVVSEYGIADLRGRTDFEVVTAMLNIADSRFQGQLLEQARRAGKVPLNYRIPEPYRHNFPEKLADRLADARRIGAFPDYPFGTDLTETEQVLAKALGALKGKTRTLGGKLRAILAARGADPSGFEVYMERMNMQTPKSLADRLLRKLLSHELHRILGKDAS